MKSKKAEIIIILVLTLFEIGTKGWWALILGPLILAYLPWEFFLQKFAIRAGQTIKNSSFELLRYAQLLSGFLTVATIVGFGDNDEVSVFGFYMTNSSDPIAQLSTTLSFVFAGVALITTAVLMWRIYQYEERGVNILLIIFVIFMALGGWRYLSFLPGAH